MRSPLNYLSHQVKALPMQSLISSATCPSTHCIPIDIKNNLEWTSIPLFETIGRIIARIDSLVFLGPSMSRSTAWIETSTQSGHEVINVANAVKRFQPWLRPLACWILPEMRALARHWRTGGRLVSEFVVAANRDESSEGPQMMG